MATYTFEDQHRTTEFRGEKLSKGSPLELTDDEAKWFGELWSISELKTDPEPQEEDEEEEEEEEDPQEESEPVEEPEPEPQEEPEPVEEPGELSIREIAMLYTNGSFREKQAYANQVHDEGEKLLSKEDVNAWLKARLNDGG